MRWQLNFDVVRRNLTLVAVGRQLGLSMRSLRYIARGTSAKKLLRLRKLLLILVLLSHLLVDLVVLETVHALLSLLLQVLERIITMLLQIVYPSLAELLQGVLHLLFVAD